MLLQRLHERLSHLNGDLLTLSGTQGQIQLDLPACISEDRKRELMKEYDDAGMRIKKIEEEIASITAIMACMKKARNHGKLESEEEDDVVKKGSGGKKKKDSMDEENDDDDDEALVMPKHPTFFETGDKP